TTPPPPGRGGAGGGGKPQDRRRVMAQLSDDCFAFGGSLLSIDAARQMIFERGTPVAGAQRVPLPQPLARALAEHISAPIDVPGYDNAAVDGYAVRFDYLHADRPS